MNRVLLAVVALLAAAAHAHASLTADKRESHVQRAMQLSLLHLFGFKSRPRSRRDAVPTHVPPTMLQLYRRQRRLVASGIHFVRRDSSNANTVRSFTHSASPDDDDNSDALRFRYRFNVTGVAASEEPRAAELRIYRRAVPLANRTDDGDGGGGGGGGSGSGSGNAERLQRVDVYDVVRPNTNRHEALVRLVDTRVVDVRQSRWESFDVLPLVERWRLEPDHNHGLVVQVSNVDGSAADSRVVQHHVRLRRDAGTSESTWLAMQPVLLVFTDDGRTAASGTNEEGGRGGEGGHLRTRRSPGGHNIHRPRRKGQRNNCRRHSLYVDFNDVGWNDWIVAPPGYQAYYCHGECPFPLADHLNATNHAVVQTLVNSVKPKAVPRACCVPTKLTPISMLYLDEYDKVVLKNYQDMVVEGCGCR